MGALGIDSFQMSHGSHPEGFGQIPERGDVVWRVLDGSSSVHFGHGDALGIPWNQDGFRGIRWFQSAKLVHQYLKGF